MEKFLADTSVWIASLSRKGHERLKEIMREKILEGTLVTTGMVLLELLRGTRNDKEYEELRKKLSILPFLTVDDSIWLEVAKLGLFLRSKGVQSSIPDLFIAQIAIQNHCIVVHCDHDYENIAKHTGLKTLSFLN